MATKAKARRKIEFFIVHNRDNVLTAKNDTSRWLECIWVCCDVSARSAFNERPCSVLTEQA